MGAVAVVAADSTAGGVGVDDVVVVAAFVAGVVVVVGWTIAVDATLDVGSISVVTDDDKVAAFSVTVGVVVVDLTYVDGDLIVETAVVIVAGISSEKDDTLVNNSDFAVLLLSIDADWGDGALWETKLTNKKVRTTVTNTNKIY